MLFEFPNIDPIALQIGPLAIRWYALAYMAGIILGWHYMLRLAKNAPAHQRPNAQDLDDFITYAVMGIVLGGRIGYVSFYNWGYYQHHLGDILKLWEGGMSFHGGMLGVLVVMILFAHKRGLNLLRLSDYATAAAPIGLFFGRIANFINGELYGRITNHPFGMIFPHGGNQPRHPSQLYEAATEGALLFIILFIMMRTPFIRARAGIVSGTFLLGYGIARFAIENVREPDAHIGLVVRLMSMGQILSLPMILFGAALIIWAMRRAPQSES